MDGWSDDEIHETIQRLQNKSPGTSLPSTPSRRAPFGQDAPVSTTKGTRPRKSAAEAPRLTAETLSEFRAGLPLDLLRKHQDHCHLGVNCGVCKLARRALRWMSMTQIDKVTFPYSWLEARAPGDPAWGAGCRLCRLAFNRDGDSDDGGSWAQLNVRGQSLQICCLRTHQRSSRHDRARTMFLLALAGVDSTDVLEASVAAPPLQNFILLLQKLRESHGRLTRKQHTMAWCLFEALREEERSFLATASCMTLAQDARANRLLTRWVACGSSSHELVVRSGVLQLHRGDAAGAVALQLTTRKGLKNFATKRRVGPNMHHLRVQQQLDQGLHDHLVAITEVFVADGAADEQMAGELLRPLAGHNDDQCLIQTLPNLKLVVMDRAHASRRILQRTWDKDEYLNSLLKPILWDSQSLVRILQNSDVAKTIFHDLQFKEEDNNRQPAANMGYAKQRFDSYAKPLARLIDHFDAATKAAEEMIRRRPAGDNMARGCTKALNILDNEAVLQLGMLADCAEVALRFTRFLDAESYDRARLPAKLCDFCQVCDFLFMKGGCFTWPGGRTEYVLNKLLTCRRLIFATASTPHTIGDDVNPLSDEIRQRCLARMVNWWRLARQVLEADFPHYDLLNSFSVFDLDIATDRATAMVTTRLTEQEEEALATWAERLGLDLAALKDEFLNLRGLAVSFRLNCSDTLESWQQAVFETQISARRRANYPIATLLPVLRRFAAYTGSTSGVEQDFSKFKRALGETRNFSPQTEERIAVLASRKSTPDADSVLAKRARLIWAECCGTPRSKRHLNLPRCGPRLKRLPPVGEAAAARERQASLATSVVGNGDPVTATGAIQMAATMWGPLQATELLKRRALARKRRLDAIFHGNCTPGDGDDMAEVRAHGRRVRQKREQLIRQYITNHTIPHASLHRDLPAGTRVFIDDSLKCNALIQHAISRRQWRHVDDRVLAQVLVVPDPARPDAKNTFVAALGGRLLVSMGYMTDTRGHGVAIQYERALRLPRYLWVSPACEVRFAASLQVMRRLVQQAGTGTEPRSRWKFDTSEEFLARRGRGVGGQRELVALVVAAELTCADLRCYPRRITLPAFLKQCAKIKRAQCQVGALGS